VRNKRIVIVLVILIGILSILSSLFGILSSNGDGSYLYETIRGEEVLIYGKGIYRHMSKEVAIQGIAQDYVTLFIGIPVLLISLIFTIKKSLSARYVLTGTIGYFLLTYLFYLIMGMYNELFLVYAILMGTSFFALVLLLLSFDINVVITKFKNVKLKFSGIFLVFNSLAIGLLWLSVVVTPLLNGDIYPIELEHYTTLIVQGMDLGLLLPLSFISGLLLLKKEKLGFLVGPIYLVFLTILMTALSAKVIYMGIEGYEIIPAIFIMPIFAIVSCLLSFLSLQKL